MSTILKLTDFHTQDTGLGLTTVHYMISNALFRSVLHYRYVNWHCIWLTAMQIQVSTPVRVAETKCKNEVAMEPSSQN